MRVLVVGSGGREHALVWALRKSPRLTALFCAPGNAGIGEIADCRDIGPSEFDRLVAFCREERIDLVVIGPEAPLVEGLVDVLSAAGIRAFGPSKAAARLEGSKRVTKELCSRYGIPTAEYATVMTIEDARAEITRRGAPIVVKANGLAAGKGVVVAETVEEALEAVEQMMSARRFGDAGAELVSRGEAGGRGTQLLRLRDGTTALPFGSAQDHKPVGDGDTGPNTGGMGAYTPAPAVDASLERRIMAEILEPTLAGLAAEGTPFRGVLFAGLMLTGSGPKLIEFNVRFGDPECEVLMRRLKSDLLELLLAATDGNLAGTTVEWDPRASLGVVMAAEGYPGDPVRGTTIDGLVEAAAAAPDIEIFHAGTARADGRLVAAGGRVLVVTALGQDVREAQRRAYAAVDRVDWPGGFCRHDIGWRAT